MQRRFSRMSATGLQKFIDRWELTKAEAAQRLGMSERAVYAHLSGERKIPQQLAMLITALDELWTIKRQNSEK
jgi:plasmid maintenance system antidote protein VapI